MPAKPTSNNDYTSRTYRKHTKKLRKSRDTHICWICGDIIDMSLPHTNRMSFTADHVDPTSLGGSLLGEIRPAHRSCNSRRGNDVGPTPRQQYPTSRKW